MQNINEIKNSSDEELIARILQYATPFWHIKKALEIALLNKYHASKALQTAVLCLELGAQDSDTIVVALLLRGVLNNGGEEFLRKCSQNKRAVFDTLPFPYNILMVGRTPYMVLKRTTIRTIEDIFNSDISRYADAVTDVYRCHMSAEESNIWRTKHVEVVLQTAGKLSEVKTVAQYNVAKRELPVNLYGYRDTVKALSQDMFEQDIQYLPPSFKEAGVLMLAYFYCNGFELLEHPIKRYENIFDRQQYGFFQKKVAYEHNFPRVQLFTNAIENGSLVINHSEEILKEFHSLAGLSTTNYRKLEEILQST